MKPQNKEKKHTRKNPPRKCVKLRGENHNEAAPSGQTRHRRLSGVRAEPRPDTLIHTSTASQEQAPTLISTALSRHSEYVQVRTSPQSSISLPPHRMGISNLYYNLKFCRNNIQEFKEMLNGYSQFLVNTRVSVVRARELSRKIYEDNDRELHVLVLDPALWPKTSLEFNTPPYDSGPIRFYTFVTMDKATYAIYLFSPQRVKFQFEPNYDLYGARRWDLPVIQALGYPLPLIFSNYCIFFERHSLDEEAPEYV